MCALRTTDREFHFVIFRSSVSSLHLLGGWCLPIHRALMDLPPFIVPLSRGGRKLKTVTERYSIYQMLIKFSLNLLRGQCNMNFSVTQSQLWVASVNFVICSSLDAIQEYGSIQISLVPSHATFSTIFSMVY